MWLQTAGELKFVIDAHTPIILMLRPRRGAQR